jgi:hypothetical protein
MKAAAVIAALRFNPGKSSREEQLSPANKPAS